MANLKRRGFLGGMGALFATTPEKILKASGVKVSPLGETANFPSGGLAGISLSGSSSINTSWATSQKLRLAALKMFAPSWFDEKRRRDARAVHVLAPHIASLRSVSPSAKINMQREFQYRTRIDEELRDYELQELSEAFDT